MKGIKLPDGGLLRLMGHYLQLFELLLNGEFIRFCDANSLLSVFLSEATNSARWLPYLQGYPWGNYCVILSSLSWTLSGHP